MKYKINKEDGSGEEGTYEVLPNFIVKMNSGDKYTLQGYEDASGKIIRVLSHQHNMQKIWTIFEDKGVYFAEQYGVEREGETPSEVVAKMQWNLV